MIKKLLSFALTISAFQAFSQTNLNVTLAGRLKYPGQTCANIWGYVDTAGNEYALVGASKGMSIVNITNPNAPFQVKQIPVANPTSSQNEWREIETWGKYAYVTTEAGGGLQIVDLSHLPDTVIPYTYWTPSINSQQLSSIHALHIDNGRVYLYGSNVGNQGAIIAQVDTTPMNPVYVGSWDNRYIHDGYVRGDTLYAGHIYDGDCEIVDLTNPASGVAVADFQTPGVFTHNTWLSQDSKTCFTTDEVANSYLAAFDLSNLSNITELDRIQTSPGSNSIVHNTHIINKGGTDYAVTSWYTEGITITDVSRPTNLVQVGNYDTYTGTQTGFNGCWGVYPFLPSGTIVASDIDSGLFVLTPTYARGCYLEGVVENCNTNAPMSGVNVAIQVVKPQSNSTTDVTDFLGQYAVGIAQPDTYLVVFSKPGFTTDTDTVVLAAGVITVDTFKLCPLPTFAYSGKIFDNSTTYGIPAAHVTIYDSNSRWDTITDANGNFTVPNMFMGTYTIASGKWGYVTRCVNSQTVTSTSGLFSMGLDAGIYDDFIWDFGWTVSGNATSGIWERGKPLGTYDSNNALCNPATDANNDCGTDAFVTGNQGMSATDDDVDSGSTVLTSPIMDLSSYINPYIFYTRWKRLSFNSTDTIHITVSNGTTTATLENIMYTTGGQAAWQSKHFQLSNYITPSSTVTFSMKVSDLGADNIIEGGLDKFYVLDSNNSAVHEWKNDVSLVIYPNPFSDRATMQVIGNESSVMGAEFKLFDIYGREVNSFIIRHSSFVIEKGTLPAGVYFYRVSAPAGGNEHGEVIGSGKLCIE